MWLRLSWAFLGPQPSEHVASLVLRQPAGRKSVALTGEDGQGRVAPAFSHWILTLHTKPWPSGRLAPSGFQWWWQC